MPETRTGRDNSGHELTIDEDGYVFPIADFQRIESFRTSFTAPSSALVVHYRLADAGASPSECLQYAPTDAEITVPTPDDASTYRVTVDGNDFDYVAQGGDGEAEILAGIAAAVDGQALAPDTLSAVVEGSLVRVRRLDSLGNLERFPTISVSVPAGTGVLAIVIRARRGDKTILNSFPEDIGTRGKAFIIFRCEPTETVILTLSDFRPGKISVLNRSPHTTGS